ncbi:M15 family metallopeptidase [Cellulomonas sp. C5510]|uniref:M15 family metallopeptidase n=1 Tax=Cellulomonas sp. C5510 TaxID=2871170 RepID=UPI001C98CF69|nr:M15 family metallopeptidase [Cellulomonas sp. C5510]QZN84147.1 D-alanyl-D-alanine carboxypeptidase family protein [Cellulomonas sp. C5510]
MQVAASLVAGALGIGLALHDASGAVPPGGRVTAAPASAADTRDAAPLAAALAGATASAARDHAAAVPPADVAEGARPAADPEDRLLDPDPRARGGPGAVPEVPVPLVLPELRPPARAGLDLSARSTSDPASPWVVVNKSRPLDPVDWAPSDLVTVAGYEVRASVADPLARMLGAAAADGVALELRSGFRSRAYQEQVHAGWVAQVGGQRADEVSARAGHSEHQTGLAVDVGSGSAPECDFQDCFAQTPEGRWVAEHAAEHGFLLRYTAQGQPVTGFAPEGWHLRYVGEDLLAEMERRGVGTLEELFRLPGGPGHP